MALSFSGFPGVSISGASTIWEKVFVYRAEIAEWTGGSLKKIADYIDNFQGIASPGNYRNPGVPSAGSSESTSRTELLSRAQDLSNSVGPVVSSMMTKFTAKLVTNEPTVDLQGMLDDLIQSLKDELDGSQDLGTWKTMIKAVIDTSLLASTYDLLTTDTILIDTTVTNFKSRRKSELDTENIKLDRRTINEMISKGQMGSTRGNELIVRLNTKKSRLFLEIDSEAEELRTKLTIDAYERAFKRMQTKIQAHQLIPANLISLPAPVWQILADVIGRVFISPSTFVGAIPQILGDSMRSLEAVAQLLQADRYKTVDSNLNSDRNLIQLIQAIAGNLIGIAESAGKFATFEGTAPAPSVSGGA